VERAVILAGARGRLGREDFGRQITKGARVADDGDGGGSATPSLPSQLPLNLGELEKLAINRALQETGGHRRRAAELLGISERTLRNKLNK
jgi:DNA-binding NtrC family response regulator